MGPFTHLHAFLAKRQFPNVSEEKLKMAKFDRKSFRTVLVSFSEAPVPEKKPGAGEKSGSSDENNDGSAGGAGNAQTSSESMSDSSAGEPDLSENSTTVLRIKGLMRQMISATNNLTQVALNVTRVKQANRRAGNVSNSSGEFRAEPLGFLSNRSRELLFDVAAGKASAAVSDITGSADALLNRHKSKAGSNGDSASGDAAKVDDDGDDDDEEEQDDDGSVKGESKEQTASKNRLKKEMSVASRISALKALKKMRGIKRRLRDLGSIVLPSKKVKNRDAELASDSGREAVVQETDPNTGAVSYRKMSLQERLDAADAKSLVKMVKADMNNNTDVYTVVAKLKLLSNSSGNLTSNKTLLGNMQTVTGMPNSQRLTREANASFDSDLLLAPASMEGVTPKAAEALQAARQYGAVRRFALAIRASTEARLANITRTAAEANASLMSPNVVAAAQSGNNGAVGVANKSLLQHALAGVNQEIPQQDIIKEQKKLEHTHSRVEDLLEQGKLPQSQLHADLGTVASSITNLVNHLQEPLKNRSNLNSTLSPRQNSTNATVSLDKSVGGKQHSLSHEEAEFTDEEDDELPEPKNSSKKGVQRSLKLKLSSDYHWARHHETKFRLALQGDIAETLNLESSAVSIDTIEPGSLVVRSTLRQTLEVGESNSTSFVQMAHCPTLALNRVATAEGRPVETLQDPELGPVVILDSLPALAFSHEDVTNKVPVEVVSLPPGTPGNTSGSGHAERLGVKIQGRIYHVVWVDEEHNAPFRSREVVTVAHAEEKVHGIVQLSNGLRFQNMEKESYRGSRFATATNRLLEVTDHSLTSAQKSKGLAVVADVGQHSTKHLVFNDLLPAAVQSHRFDASWNGPTSKQ